LTDNNLQYQLNGDVEYHNPAEPSTTSCPLLPGQPVNVLEVPIQLGGEDQRSRNGSTSSGTPATCTMNPDDKYLNPRPPPVPKLSCFTALQSSLHELTAPSASPGSGRSPWSSKSRTYSPCSRSSPTLKSSLSCARMTSTGRMSRSLSPKRSSMPRVALCRGRPPLSAGADSEWDRGRRHGIHVERKIDLEEPVRISRTDEARRCSPLRVTQSESHSRISPFSPYPVEERDSEPSLTAERPISRQDICVSQITWSRSNLGETSSLRHSVRFEEADVGSDIYGFQRESKDLGIENTICPTLLEAPFECQIQAAQHVSLEYPTDLPRVWTSEDASNNHNPDTASNAALTQNATTPNLNNFHTLEPPIFPPNGAPPQLLRNHFSAWNTTTVAPSPTSPDIIDDHTSPSLTSATDTSSDPLSPYRLSFHFDTPSSPELDGTTNTTPHEYRTSTYSHPTSRPVDVADNHPTFDPLPNLDHNAPTFQAYSLPALHHASDLTLRKLPTPRGAFSPAPPRPAPDSHDRSPGLVQSWNDGSAHRLTAKEELLDDLAYLGDMIVPY